MTLRGPKEQPGEQLMATAFFGDLQEAMQGLKCLERVEPNQELTGRYSEIYEHWKKNINIE